jgi:hypothetical protein
LTGSLEVDRVLLPDRVEQGGVRVSGSGPSPVSLSHSLIVVPGCLKDYNLLFDDDNLHYMIVIVLLVHA